MDGARGPRDSQPIEPGWWQGLDQKWYPPEALPGGVAASTPAASAPPSSPPPAPVALTAPLPPPPAPPQTGHHESLGAAIGALWHKVWQAIGNFLRKPKSVWGKIGAWALVIFAAAIALGLAPTLLIVAAGYLAYQRRD